MKKYNLRITLKIILISLIFWIAITSNIQRFKTPRLSETELFMLIPRNVILDFEK